MGRQDLWHVHMKGLRYIIARNGGLSAEWGHVLNKIRKYVSPSLMSIQELLADINLERTSKALPTRENYPTSSLHASSLPYQMFCHRT